MAEIIYTWDFGDVGYVMTITEVCAKLQNS